MNPFCFRFSGAAFAGCLLFASLNAAPEEEIRGLWAQAWVSDLHTPENVDQVIANAAAANINTLIPQVRRRGDTLYFSDIEPRASGVQDGFDALEYMIEQAHAQDPPIEVHAWIVVYPVGQSGDPEHTTNQNPEWFMRDADGNIDVPPGSGNHQHDPGHPGVHQHLLDISMELIENYDIDGLHFDYIRYPEHAGDWGHNPVSIDRFHQLYDRDDTPAPHDEEWRQFRRDQITQTLRRIYLYAADTKPEVKLSAATITWGHTGVSNMSEWLSSSAYAGVYQDWRGWMEEGILDLNIPMNYYREHNNTPPENHAQAYRNWSGFAKDHAYDRHVAIGPGIYLNTLENAITQMRHTREESPGGNHAEGVVGYTYHATNNEGLPFSAFQNALTQPSSYDSVTPPMFAEPAAIPDMPWKSNPTTGHLKGYVHDAETGEPLDGAVVSLSGEVERAIQTDPHGFYGFVDLPPGAYEVSPAWQGDTNPAVEAAVSAGEVSRQDLVYAETPPTTGTLEGLVSNATTGQPVENATVYLTGEENDETGTDAQGFYQFQELQPGHYTVSAAWDESDDDAPAVMISIAVAETTEQDLHFAVSGDGGGTPGEEIILDNVDDEVTFEGSDWRTGTGSEGYGDDYRWTHAPEHEEYEGLHTATYAPDLPEKGLYRIETWYQSGWNRAPDTPYIVSDGTSEQVVPIDQQENGGQWVTVLDQIYLDPADSPTVTVSNEASPIVVMADAIRWTLLEETDPEWVITTETEGEGRIEGLPPEGTATHGSMVDLFASGENGYAFSHWEGNAWGSENPLLLEIGANLEIRAVFTPSAYLLWAQENLPEAVDDPNADPGKRGIPAIHRFAFGLDAVHPDVADLPRVDRDDGNQVVLTFQRPVESNGITYRFEISNDLGAWEILEDPAYTVDTISDDIEEVSVTLPNEEAATFIRLLVELEGW